MRIMQDYVRPKVLYEASWARAGACRQRGIGKCMTEICFSGVVTLFVNLFKLHDCLING